MESLTNIKDIRKKIYISNNKSEWKKNIEKHLLKSEEDIKLGRVKSAEEVFNKWKKEYGL